MASSRRTGTNENISTFGSGGGRDYTSLATWEAATDINLVSATQSEVLECYNDSIYNQGVTLQGATTNSSYFRIIRPASGEGHSGIPNTGVRFHKTTSGIIFVIDEENSQVQDLSCRMNYPSGSNNLSLVIDSGGVNAAMVGMFLDLSTNSEGSGRGYQVAANGAALINCLAANIDRDGYDFKDDITTQAYAYNCNAIDCGRDGFAGDDNIAILKNCLATGSVQEDFNIVTLSGTERNASQDATAPGTNNRINQTFTFVNAGSDDFHLASNDAGARTFGANLSADGGYAFDDDIDRVVRPATWDIGFDQVVVPGPANLGKINTALKASVGKINTVSLANIAKVNSVA